MEKNAEQIAKDKHKEMNDKKVKDAEARDAAKDSSKSKDQKVDDVKKPVDEKTKGEEARVKAEAQAKDERRILETPDDKLNSDEKAKKVELKKKSVQAKVDTRIGELSSQVKALEQSGTADKSEIKALNDKIAALEQPKESPEETKKKEATNLKKVEQDRISKNVDADKELPREERREMSKEELDAWMIEDNVSAQEWISDRSVRRHTERFADRETLNAQKYFSTLLDKQKPFAKKVIEKHPELDTSVREKELKDAGKSPKEISKILLEENPKVKLCAEILKEHPEFLTKDNGPELVEAELSKRLSGDKGKAAEKGQEKNKDGKTVAELNQEIADLNAEITRRDAADGAAGDGSSHDGDGGKAPKTEKETKQLEIAAKAGISPERLKKRLKERSKIPGAAYGGEDE